MKTSDIMSLHVLLHQKKIGSLTLLPGDQTLFTFDESYIANPSRPTLSLSFKNKLGELITTSRPTRSRVLPFFSNLLPEGHLRDYLAARSGIHPAREFYLLWVLGQDLPGAITIVPEKKSSLPGENENTAKRKNKSKALRFSLAGVQLKFSAIAAASGGMTIPATGMGGSWILKLPSQRFENVPENEFAMLSLARAIGIDVPDIKLVPISKIKGLPNDIDQLKGSKNALAVCRFDRSKTEAIHTEDFAQVFGVYPREKYGKASYKNIIQVIWAETGEDGVSEFIRRLVFNTLIGNADMHLKNWSLIYPNQRTAKLSPAYDFVSTIAYLPDTNMALNYIKTKLMSKLSIDLLSELAAKANLPKHLVLTTAKETVGNFFEIWKKEKRNLPLTKTMVKKIESHFKQIELVRAK